MFRSITNSTSKNLSAGGTLSGDVTITGDLTVQGNGTGNYDEIVEGNLILTAGSKLGVGTGDVTLSLPAVIKGPNTDTGDAKGQLQIEDDAAIANTPTMGIRFQGQYTSGGATATFGGITVQKANTSNGDLASNMFLSTRNTTGTPVTAITIDKDQQVGIGTSSPEERIHSTGAIVSTGVNNTGATAGTERAFIDLVSNKARIGHFRGTTSAGSGGLQFYTDSVERARIDASGNLLIGTTSSSDQAVQLYIHEDDSAVGNTGIHIENAKSDDAAVLILEGARTSTNDTAQVLFRNSDDSVARIVCFSGHGSNNDSGELRFDVSADGTASSISTAMTIDTAGRLGLGTTPKAFTLFTPLQISTSAVLTGRAGHNQLDLANNWYYDGAEKRINAGYVGRYTQSSAGEHQFFTAGTDSADSSITFGTAKLTIDNSGNVGIGVVPETSHSSKATLQIGGLAAISASLAQSAGGSTWLGNNVYINDSGQQAHIVTDEASVYRQVGGEHYFQTVASGSADAAISFTTNMIIDINSRISLGNNDSSGATSNTIFGRLAGNAVTTGAIDNVLIGNEAGNDVTTGDYLVAIGSHALSKEDVGRSSIAIGASALGSQNTAGEGSVNTIGIGTNAGFYNVTGTENVHIGHNSGLGTDGQGGSNITAVGNEALKVAYGQDNVAIGRQAGLAVTSGVRNCLIGNNTGDAITDANYVTAVGIFAGSAINHTDANGTTLLGYSAGLSITDGIGNVAIGYESAKLLTTGNYNTAVGHQALGLASNTGSQNTAIGFQSGLDITSGVSNTLIGSSSGFNLNTGGNNVAIGDTALAAATNSSNIVAIGIYAGDAINDAAADGTVAIGRDALGALTSGAANVAIGFESQLAITDSQRNTSVGYQSLKTASTGDSNNTAIGYASLEISTTGGNTAVGSSSSQFIDTGENNTALGYGAMTSSGSGNDASLNVAVGYLAFNGATDGDQNTIVGASANPSAGTGSNQTVIGYNATGVADNSVTLGNASVTDVYMSQDSGAKIHGATADLETNITGGGHVLYLLNDGNSNNRTGIKIQVGAYTPSSAGDNVFATFFDGNGSALGGIQNSSNVDLPEFFEGSDERIKDNIKDTEVNALEVINSLQFREFNKKNQSKKTKIGLVAQEVLKSKIPELVGTGSNESYKEYFDEDENEMYTIGIGNMTYYLMKAVQELSAKVEELEKK
tara:strand:+ start:32464 stop:36057 length:3594 start_codon:yes stop_codon:yes gene_type:complete